MPPTLALFEVAERALAGVGDAALGQWEEVTDRAVHIRRRLTPAEMKRGGIAALCDVRGTPEHAARIERVRPFLPPHMRQLPAELLP